MEGEGGLKDAKGKEPQQRGFLGGACMGDMKQRRGGSPRAVPDASGRWHQTFVGFCGLPGKPVAYNDGLLSMHYGLF